jgi:hypothetical protein
VPGSSVVMRHLAAPIAPGWPVSENGPAPAVRSGRWRDAGYDAALLCVPCVDWLRPWQ